MSRVDLHNANLRYTALRELDLRRFDLTGLDLRHTDLSGSDLSDAKLHGTDLRGADLSNARLHGTELLRAKLYNDELLGGRGRKVDRSKTKRKKFDPPQSNHLLESSSPTQIHLMKETKTTLSDREAYTLGEQTLMLIYDSVKTHKLFPVGFDFTIARQIFDAWLAQSGDPYSEKEINAMWIGFAHQFCDLYHVDEPEGQFDGSF